MNLHLNSTKSGLTGVLCTVALCCQAALGATIYVDDSASGLDNGSSWEDAYIGLQDALAVAIDGSEIRVAQGTYKPTAGIDRAIAFQLVNGVVLRGGYAGAGAPDPNARNVALYETVLSGDIGTPDDPVDNSIHVVTSNGTDDTTVLEGITISGGNAHGMGTDRYGGGMYNVDSSPTMISCTFIDNTAGYGGGLFNDNSSPKVTDCNFIDNSASNFGGGVENYNGSNPTMTGCVFSGNTAGQRGAGMLNNNSSPKVTNCTFSFNASDVVGGGMYNLANSSPTVANCTFSGNSADYDGCAMYNDQCSPIVTDCTFSDNSGGNTGGGMLNIDCSPTVTNCTFSGNSTSSGGGMYNTNSSPMILHCTFSGNTARFGGGVINITSSPMVTNCTFSGNAAELYGGGMYNYGNSNPNLTNCILWGNTAPDGPQVYDGTGSITTVSYSDVQGAWPGNGNIDADPMFQDPNGLDGIGGTTDDNLRLSYNSPCIDAGDSTGLWQAEIWKDMDGQIRYFDISGVTDTGIGPVAFVDMGTYESSCSGLAGDSNCDGVVNLYDLCILANHWLQSIGPE